jgi:hypothetical protein
MVGLQEEADCRAEAGYRGLADWLFPSLDPAGSHHQIGQYQQQHDVFALAIVDPRMNYCRKQKHEREPAREPPVVEGRLATQEDRRPNGREDHQGRHTSLQRSRQRDAEHAPDPHRHLQDPYDQRRIGFRDVVETEPRTVKYSIGHVEEPRLVAPLRPYREVHDAHAEDHPGHNRESTGYRPSDNVAAA